MKRRFALLIAVLATAVAAASAAPAAPIAPAAAVKSCSLGYVHASLPWGHKCLREGQFCKHDGDRYYHRYGFHCHVSDSRGNYHLT